MFSIAKQSKGSEVDFSCICSHSMGMLVLQMSLAVLSSFSDQMQNKYLKKT